MKNFVHVVKWVRFYIYEVFMTKVCKVEGCENKVFCKDYCSGHYQRVRNNLEMDSPIIRRKKPSKTNIKYVGCLVEGCDRSHKAKGYCDAHYRRFLLKKDLNKPLNGENKCKIKGCKNPYHTRGYCTTHIYANDKKTKIITNLRSRLNVIIKRRIRGAKIYKTKKLGSARKDLGCDIQFFIQYLESLFQPGMSWENYGGGKDKWNIDHIIPISTLDPDDPESYKKLCHYTNLQPLWQIDNIKKSNKLPEELEDIEGKN